MNSRLAILVLLFSSICFSQAKPTKNTTPIPPAQKEVEPSAQKPALSAPPAAASVGEDEAVITVPGVCPAGTATDNCSTKITRADFERLLAAMNPNIPVEARRSIAGSYGQLLALSAEAQKEGIDKEPNLQLQMRVQNMSLLAQALQKKIIEKSKPTQQDIENYYKENSAKYEELNLRRIVILKSANAELKSDQLKALADDIRERAAAGEDPDKLQVEAYKTAKTAGTPPTTALGWKKPGMMDPRHEPQIVNLKAGEVTPVMEDGQAYYIYKVEARRTEPLDSVRKDIENALQTERAKKEFQQLTEKSKPILNAAYFGPDPATKAPPSLKNPPPPPK